MEGMDLVLAGRRIRERRLKFGLSTQELAEKAGIARYTVIRVEEGKPCTLATFQKIRSALHLFTDQLTRPVDAEEGPCAVHRAERTRWSVSIPKSEYQKRLLDDDPIHVDDPAERRRLGELGFQPFFTAILDSELPGGVTSHALMELHQPSWVDAHFGEEFVYCLRGPVTLTIDGASCTLQEGDAMTFDATKPHQYAPAHPVEPGDPVPLILLVVAMRPGERVPRPT